MDDETYLRKRIAKMENLHRSNFPRWTISDFTGVSNLLSDYTTRQYTIAELRQQITDARAVAERAEKKVAELRQAIESVKAQAKATPVCAEDEVKGASVYNWLMYVYRLLEPALKEDEA